MENITISVKSLKETINEGIKSLNERMVIKVPNDNNSPMPPMNDNMPPMDDDMGMPDDSLEMDDEMGDENMTNFGPEFDAGVEADAESDPKKYIQQLTGKLSQEIRKYNQENEDNELNKYILGMIISQTTSMLSPKEKNEIIKKINKSEMDGDSDEVTDEEMPMDDEMPMEDDGMGEEMPMDNNNMTESRNWLSEVLNNEIVDGEYDSTKRKEIKRTKKITSRNKPFISKF